MLIEKDDFFGKFTEWTTLIIPPQLCKVKFGGYNLDTHTEIQKA